MAHVTVERVFPPETMEEYFSRTIPNIENAVEAIFPRGITLKWLKENIDDKNKSVDPFWLEEHCRRPFYDLFDRGGKRIRPVLSCLAHYTLGGNHPDIYLFSAISEIVHNGTLIIDDIEDNSPLRRGAPSIHSIFGAEVTINAGNLLYFLPQIVIARSDLEPEKKVRIYGAFYEAMTKLHLGQGMDISWSKTRNYGITLQDYLQMIAYKTGALLGFSMKTGAVLAETPDIYVRRLGAISENIGMAFQIRDDILNLGNNLGKECCEDIREGKLTYLVVDAISRANKKEKKILEDILSSEEKSEDDINLAIGIMESCGSFERADHHSKRLVLDVRSEFDLMLEESQYKKILFETLDYIVERKK